MPAALFSYGKLKTGVEKRGEASFARHRKGGGCSAHSVHIGNQPCRIDGVADILQSAAAGFFQLVQGLDLPVTFS
ncbi:MAG: hypothetical protein K1W03_08445 [Mailhella sp.]